MTAEVQRKPVFSPQFLTHLADNNPLGMNLSADDVQAWFDLNWVKYETYRYKNHKRAIAAWWSRVSQYDIAQARERIARLQETDEVAVMEALAEDIQEPSTQPRVDHFKRMSKNAF